MSTSRYEAARALFDAAVGLAPSQRAEFLSQECRDDVAMRRLVERMLESHEAGLGSFLEPPWGTEGERASALATGGTAAPAAARAVEDGDPSSPGALPSLPGYRILRRIGEGGMGVVYEAEQEQPRRRVALKVIRGGGHVTDLQIRLFRREIESLARLSHPAIAAIHDAGRTPFGQHYFTMELVDGVPLTRLVEQPLPESGPARRDALRRRLGLFLQICDGITYAHQRGVIHRDLKPSNVVVIERSGGGASASGTTSGGGASSSGGAGRTGVKILDFGLARITDPDASLASLESEVGRIKGTLAYMSPEQARGDPQAIDIRTDVYSLGVVLYELVTGSRPYDVSHLPIPEAIRVICERDPVRPASVARSLHGDLETIILKTLEKAPDRRYPSVGALAEDVGRYLADQPILARPQSTMYQLRKLVRRHRAPFALGAALALLLVASSITMAVLYRGQLREAERARREAAKANSINDFMQSIFASTSAGASQGALREVLDEAAGRIESEFADQPEVLAALHVTMGRSYASLFTMDQARSHLERGIELLRAGGAVSRMDLADALVACANVLAPHTEAGPEAEAAIREAINIHRELLGPEDPVMAQDLKTLEEILRKEGMQAGGEEALRESLRILAEAQGTENDEYAAQLTALASMASDQGARQEADSLFLAALAIQRRLHPGGDVGMAGTLNAYGCFRWSVGDLDGADRAFRESLEMYRREGADADFGITFPLRNLADLDRQRGDLDEAAAFNREAMDIRIRLIGEDTFVVSNAQGALARVLSDAGRHEEALATIEQALDFFRRRDLLPAYWTRAWYRDVLTAAGRPAEAETALREWLADAEVRHGPDHFEAAVSRLELGQFLLDRHRYPEAEEQLLAGLRIYDACGAHWLGTQPLNLVVDLYDAWGRPEAAAPYRERLAAVTPVEPPGGIFAPRR